jgi:hypothetical protein
MKKDQTANGKGGVWRSRFQNNILNICDILSPDGALRALQWLFYPC